MYYPLLFVISTAVPGTPAKKYFCPGCKKQVLDNDPLDPLGSMGCDFDKCDVWIHGRCSGFKESDFAEGPPALECMKHKDQQRAMALVKKLSKVHYWVTTG